MDPLLKGEHNVVLAVIERIVYICGMVSLANADGRRTPQHPVTPFTLDQGKEPESLEVPRRSILAF